VGKYKYYGRDAYTGRMVIEDAKTLEEAGACMVILECVASEAAKKISETLRVPVIGAGSGPHCDGQSMNIYDILGLSIKLVPNFAKQYLNLKEKTVELLKKYKEEVQKGEFPAEEHTMHMDKGELEKLEQ
ncbi:MAG: 3-methyl-2-oxobutanoate hydroxymethyltransferase, partial [Nitrososphaeria archaeon]|nr:3-methyl-2-oxobutanoate hydroxymethyltransferase [Nitrososphaeria archaeon]NIN52020.1 3-methyl-2-oxobutanoate hydroxymethyltransferase [Nitrososphaeria archaeon]NIQ32482.1 3-methyl-2-oxobutanoate hydroxymethyltransferase [Nitrososphaeria archaeon]